MPPRPKEDHSEPGALAPTMEQVIPALAITTQPVVICGVNRKIYIGNYETVDVYAGVSLPLGAVDVNNQEALRETLAQAALLGFEMVSREANDRYRLIKNAQKGE